MGEQDLRVGEEGFGHRRSRPSYLTAIASLRPDETLELLARPE
jgi:hypothetical protein